MSKGLKIVLGVVLILIGIMLAASGGFGIGYGG